MTVIKINAARCPPRAATNWPDVSPPVPVHWDRRFVQHAPGSGLTNCGIRTNVRMRSGPDSSDGRCEMQIVRKRQALPAPRSSLLAPHSEPRAHLWNDLVDERARPARLPLPRTHALCWRGGAQWFDAGDPYGNPVSEGRLLGSHGEAVVADQHHLLTVGNDATLLCVVK